MTADTATGPARLPGLGVAPAAPGLERLPRRLGEFWSFLSDLIATVETEPGPDGPLGRSWDVEGDPQASLLARLWAYVAEGVAAYTELTANEAYLATAADWDDLRRLAGLLGYRPRPRVAAQGWVLVAVEADTDPLVPAGTRVQAPADPPARPSSEVFEVAEDTRLRSEWRELHAFVLLPPAHGASGPPLLSITPVPNVAPTHIALATGRPGQPDMWVVVACEILDVQPPPLPGGAGDLVFSLPGGLPPGIAATNPTNVLWRGPAVANVVRVRHGSTASATVGSGDSGVGGQRLSIPDAPVAYDLSPSANPVPSLVLRADGRAWDEVASLYGAGADPDFVAHLDRDGGLRLEFGDGAHGNRLPTGRGNVTAAYRVGGGLAGEVPAGAIDSLAGSVRGVRAVLGVGPTFGGADQDDERRLRALAPGRARSLGRVVSQEDVEDLALSFPGVSHARAWRGRGPVGCACGRPGLHVAALRATATGARTPTDEEVEALARFLDSRRDTTVPLCVCAAESARLKIDAQVAVDPRFDAAAAAAAARDALADPTGPLAARARGLGQPLDLSDVWVVLHGVRAVVGVVLEKTEPAVWRDGTAQDGRLVEPYRLLSVDPDTRLSARPA